MRFMLQRNKLLFNAVERNERFQKCFIDFGLWKQIHEKPQKMIIQSSVKQQQ